MSGLRFVLSAVLVLGVSIANAQITQVKETGSFQVTALQQLSNDSSNSDRGGCNASTCAAPLAFPALTTGVQTCVTECNNGASPGPDFPGNNCYDFPNPTVWYQITVPATAATLTITVNSATITNPNFMVFGTANCATYTIYNDNGECYNGAGGSSSGNMSVPAGATLLVAVSGGNGQLGDFTLCITPQADASACNVDNDLIVTGTSLGSPIEGPYLPGETVSFCYTINQYTQANCNYLHGIVPDFGDCWDASSFTAQGQPTDVTTPLTQQGSYCAGAWAWWADGVVNYNSTGNPVGAGWFYSIPAGNNPNNSWGDANGNCMSGMGSCEGATSGLSWTVCFDLTVRTDCENGVNCAVSMKTYADGETGSWTSLGCVADIPAFYNASALCCQMIVSAGTNQTICETQSTALNGSVSNNEGPTTYAWTSSPAGAMAGISDPNILNPTFTPPVGITGPITFTLTVTDDNCTIANQVTVTVTALPSVDISYANTPFCTTFINQSVVQVNGVGAFTGGTYNAAPAGLTINPSTGAITPSTSTPGDYTVTYTIPASGGCPAVPVQTTVTVTAAPTATIDYSDPFCTSDVGTESVTINGTGAYLGGTYSSTAGLTIDGPTGDITPSTSTANTYTVTYTIPASGGCAAVPVTTPVTITLEPTATISYAGPFCTSVATGQGVTLNGTGAYLGGTYSAAPAGLTINASTGAITPNTSTPGDYTVTYTIPASGGCPAVPVQTTVTITAAPTATIDYTDPFCTSDLGTESVTINGTGAYLGGTYSSSAGLTIDGPTGDITPSTSTANTYTVTYTIPASGGCAAVPVTTPVTITEQPTATISYADPFCTSISTGQAVTLNGTGSYLGGTYSAVPAGLTINASTGAITPSSSTPNTYTVTYTIPAVGGCAATPVITSVEINPIPSFTATGTDPTTCNGTDGFIVIEGLDPLTDYILTYNDDAVSQGPFNETSDAAGEITISGLNAGSYDNITIAFVSTGCGFTSPVSINLLNPGAPVLDDPADVVLCAPDTYVLPVITGTNLSGDEAYFTGANGTGTEYNAGEVISTSMLLYVYDVSGICSDQRNFTITITTPPTATISYTEPFCENTAGSFAPTLNGTGSFGGGDYSSTAGLTINTSTGNITPSTSSVNTYVVTYTIPASAGCPSEDVTTNVTITELPTATLSYAGPYCSNEGVQAPTFNGTANYTGGTFTSTAGLSIDAFTGEIDPSASTPNMYTVTYTIPASGGCSAIPVQAIVTITEVPTATISYNDPFCDNLAGSQVVTLNGTANYTGGTFSSVPGGLSIDVNNGNINASTSTANTYDITYTIPASGGCPSEDVMTTVTITELPTATISYAGPFCSSQGVQAVTFNGTANYTGGTFTSAAGLSIDATTGEIDPSASTPNVYTVTYTIPASGGCAEIPVQTTVTITESPTATISYSDPFCDDLVGSQTVSLNGTGDYLGGTFSSTPAGLTLDVDNGNINASTSTSNTYDVTYTIPASAGCPDSDVLTTVTINPTPSYTLSGTDPTVCNGTDGSIVISGLDPNENYNVTYSQGGTPQGPNGEVSDAGGDVLISGLSAGNYSNFIVEFNGCIGTNAGPVVLVNPNAPNVAPITSVTFCDQFTLPAITGSNLTGNEAYYTGTNGTGTQYNEGEIITSSMVMYIYDVNGACSDEETFTITINNTPAIDNPGNQTACDSYELPVITGTNLSGSEGYQTAGGDPLTGPITTSQTVYIYDENGLCFDEQSFVVTINPSPQVTSFVGGGTYCEGDAVTDITLVLSGSPDFTLDYTLNGNPQSTNSTTTSVNLGNVEGVYTLTSLTDAGCTASVSGTQTIVVNPVPAAPTAGDDATYCYYDEFTPMYAQTSEGGQLTWYSNAGLTQEVGTATSMVPSSESGVHVYYVTETAAGCQSEPSMVTIIVENCLTEIPTAFTPDGDGVNDQWIIADLSTNFPNNNVKVFNRWGNLLFESEGYATPWDGTFNGDQLPVGSYFFIVDFNDGGVTEPAAGTVTIIRN